MKKKNGYVFMETIVVISVLSITLLLLFASYSYILRKSRTKKMFDTTETIYKTYYFKEVLDSFNYPTLENFFKARSGILCKNITYGKSSNNYICDTSSIGASDSLYQITKVYEIDKFYYINPAFIINYKEKDLLLEFDATTIDYIRDLGTGVDSNILVVKYKKIYSDGSYEVYHSSMEVSS